MGSLEKSLDERRDAEQRDAQWVEAIDKIAQLTREGTIKWSPVESSAVKASGRAVLSAYQTEFEGRVLLLQETTPEVQPGVIYGADTDPLAAILNYRISQSRSTHRVLSLRIVDNNKSPLFVFPDVPNVVELMAAIKYQLADIDSFLGSLRAYATAEPVKSGSSG